MIGWLTLAALACVVASLVVVFNGVGLSNEGTLIAALVLLAVGVGAGVAAVVQRQWIGLFVVGLGPALALWYVALYSQ